MIGVLIRKDYRIGPDAHWAYLRQRPVDGVWSWTSGADTATVLTTPVAFVILSQLRQRDPDADMCVMVDVYQRTPQVITVPRQFQVAA